MAVRVLLVEDVNELRATLHQALRLQGGFEVVADTGHGEAGVAAAADLKPDVVVLDLGLPDLAGSELVERMRAASPESRIVVYTGSISVDRAHLRASVDAFVLKERTVNYLVDLLRDLSKEHPQAAEVELGPGTEDVAVARRFVAEHCRLWGCTAALESAQLVVSELVTNALIHARTSCRLRARFANDRLHIEVRDGSSDAPDLQTVSTEAENGRGILLVSVLSESWGIEAEPAGGKSVWAEVAVTEDATS